MTCKTLMVHLDLNSDNDAVLAVAADLAMRLDARVIGIAACQPLQVLVNESFTVEDVIEEDRQQIDREIAAAEAQFRAALQGRARLLLWRSAVTFEPLADFIAEEARAADLVISAKDVGPSLLDESHRVKIADLVMQAGRPVLLVPRHVRSLALRHVFVGWKETREARRAAADALPLLSEARECTVLEITAKGRQRIAQAHVDDVVAWLASHQVNAVPQVLARVGDEIGDLRVELLSRRCDLFVAGAYGRARLREWMFGGVTEDMLLNPDFCVLLSH